MSKVTLNKNSLGKEAKKQGIIPRQDEFKVNILNFLICSGLSFLLIMGFLGICILLSIVGCPFPVIQLNKFFDLGFFSLSTFSFITFLTMIPFQACEGRLSPGFFSRMICNPWSHFGLHVLMVSAIFCFSILAFYPENDTHEHFNLIFMALLASMVFAILFHRARVLCSIYQPYTVYKNIEQLAEEETREEVWYELLECTYKAISGRHISYAKIFLNLLSTVYQKNLASGVVWFDEDLKSLYKTTVDLPPIMRYMETKWFFLVEPSKGIKKSSNDDKNAHSNENNGSLLPGKSSNASGLASALGYTGSELSRSQKN